MTLIDYLQHRLTTLKRAHRDDATEHLARRLDGATTVRLTSDAVFEWHRRAGAIAELEHVLASARELALAGGELG